MTTTPEPRKLPTRIWWLLQNAQRAERKPWFLWKPFLWLATLGGWLIKKQVDHVLRPVLGPANDDS